MKRLARGAGAAVLAVALSTCWNDFPFLATVTDQVMVAKDLYLQIDSTTPTASEKTVDPWGTIDVEFDRDIDLATVSDATILLSPAVPWTHSYNASTHKLSIKPTALNSKSEYTVTVTRDVKGTDGSSLRDTFSWTFETALAPGGSITITGTTHEDTKYCKSENITVTVHYNQVVDSYRISTVDPPGDSDWSDVIAVDGTSPDTKTAPVSFSALPPGDGVKKVYVRFYDEDKDIETPSTVIYDTIVLDTTAPTVSVGTFPAVLNVAASTVVPGATASDAYGIKTYAWAQTAGTADAVTFSSTSVLNPTITGVRDYTTGVQVRLRATDPAGNYTDSTSTSMTVDCVAPTAPTVTGPGRTSTDTTPTFNWVGGGGGNGTFQYHLDSAAWSDETTATTLSPSCSYGAHRFYVRERDTAGNWSDSGSDPVFVYPSYLSPAQFSTVDRSPHVQWWSGESDYTFTVYARIKGDKRFETLVSNTSAYSIDLPLATLAASTYYEWYYTRKDGFKSFRYPPAIDEYFEFRTNTVK